MPLPPEATYAAWLASEELAIQKAIVLANQYYDGEQGTKLTDRLADFIGFNKDDPRFSLNYCADVVNAVAGRLIVEAFLTDDDTLKVWIVEMLKLVRFDALQLTTHKDAVKAGESFVIASYDSDSEKVTLTPMPRYTGADAGGTGYGCKAHYSTSDPAIMEFASKRWTEHIIERNRTKAIQKMNLYYPGKVIKYEMGGGGEADWQETEAIAYLDAAGQPLGIPVIHFQNPGRKSELTNAVDIQDALNKMAIDIIRISDACGMPIWVSKGFNMTTDGKPYNGTNALGVFPGVVYNAPLEGDLRKIEASNIAPQMAALDDFLIHLGKVTQTPSLSQQTSRQAVSGETLKQREEPLVAKVRERQVGMGNSWEDVITHAVRLAVAFGGESLDTEANIETEWKPAETRDEQSEELAFWTAAEKAGAAGVPLVAYLSLKGWSDEKIQIITESPEYQERRQLARVALGGDEG